MREADVSDGSRVPHGSPKHVKDLEARIAELVPWRDRKKRGSEDRAHYSRLISKLRQELGSARRHGSKKKDTKPKSVKKARDPASFEGLCRKCKGTGYLHPKGPSSKPGLDANAIECPRCKGTGEDPDYNRFVEGDDPAEHANMEPQQRWEMMAAGYGDELVDRIVASFKGAKSPKDLSKVMKNVLTKMDYNELPEVVTDGFVAWLHDKRKEELKSMNWQPRSAADARTDRVLRIRDSSGKARARR